MTALEGSSLPSHSSGRRPGAPDRAVLARRDPGRGGPTAARRSTSRAPREPPVIDGRLDDAAWKTPPLDLPEWVTYNPVSGQKLAQTTEVRITYDDAGLYFAFHCKDPEPDEGPRDAEPARPALQRRLGRPQPRRGRQRPAVLRPVREPAGVQGDILNTATDGRELARPTGSGTAPARRPPRATTSRSACRGRASASPAASDVRMGVIFWRRVSRIGMSASWPALADEQALLREPRRRCCCSDLPRPLALEVVPSATYSRNEAARRRRGFGEAENDPTWGCSVKYGITSTTAVEATVNPDFSQVESDAFQVEVNQRYPVFYSEKRPFFMEGMGTFELAGSGRRRDTCARPSTRAASSTPPGAARASGSLGKLSLRDARRLGHGARARARTRTRWWTVATRPSWSAAPCAAWAPSSYAGRDRHRQRARLGPQPRRRRRPQICGAARTG